MTPKFWNGKSVFVTGHTGFKGAWLCMLLKHLGAKVSGYALPTSSKENLYDACRIKALLEQEYIADILDKVTLNNAINEVKPDCIVHMAAQSLVSVGYADPIKTFETNIIGTANLLAASHSCTNTRAVIVVTTDKVYENRDMLNPYRETDRLGGSDPYSASKAAAELVTNAWRKSFFKQPGKSPEYLTVRSGNVFGGGDWAKDRLIPDCARAFADNKSVVLRSPTFVRPWQLVFEPLAGYLAMAEKSMTTEDPDFPTALNFGPENARAVTVQKIAQMFADNWKDGANVEVSPMASSFKEMALLQVDSTLAFHHLGWLPRYSLNEALAITARWYRAFYAGQDMLDFSMGQVKDFLEIAK